MLTIFLFSLFNENCFRGKEEIAELEAAFRRADINGDGKVKKPMQNYSNFVLLQVDIDEYVAILKSRGIFTDRKQVEKIFSLADVQAADILYLKQII